MGGHFSLSVSLSFTLSFSSDQPFVLSCTPHQPHLSSLLICALIYLEWRDEERGRGAEGEHKCCRSGLMKTVCCRSVWEFFISCSTARGFADTHTHAHTHQTFTGFGNRCFPMSVVALTDMVVSHFMAVLAILLITQTQIYCLLDCGVKAVTHSGGINRK